MSSASRQRGFTMLEILVSLLILVFGLLGMLGLQAQATVAEFESYQRGQALILVQDMVDRINANRGTAACYLVTTNPSTGAPSLGSGGATPACVSAAGTTITRAMADQDLVQWDEALKGAAEQKGGAKVGTLLSARGCVSFDTATSVYRVAVAWQGMSPTIAPTNVDTAATCGRDQYGSEALRREVSITFRIANLTGA